MTVVEGTMGCKRASDSSALSSWCLCFLQGHDSTLGLSLNEGVPAECDSVVVQVLKLQGAVPFVHTNVPQSMFRLSLRGWASVR